MLEVEKFEQKVCRLIEEIWLSISECGTSGTPF